MIEYHIYPGGKKRVVTFSYDDGQQNDARLIELFNKYGIKGTFHLNSKMYENYTSNQISNLVKQYEGHEVSCHTYQHGWLGRMPQASVVQEVIEDRKRLEQIFGYPIIGMSYPNGSYSEDAISAIKACGIVYGRTIENTNNFYLPEDFMKWKPTCHHSDALPLCERFMNILDIYWVHPMLYIWGHSFEFRTEEDWNKMEEILKLIAFNDKIWYATNIEIYNYMQAQKQLQISADETIFHNPTALDLWVEKDKTSIIHIPAGETVRFNQNTK